MESHPWKCKNVWMWCLRPWLDDEQGGGAGAMVGFTGLRALSNWNDFVIL